MDTFSYSKTFWKGLGMALLAYLVSGISAMVEAGTFPMTVEAWKQQGLALGVALLAGGAKVVHNVVKTRNMQGNPLKKAPDPPNLYGAWLIGGFSLVFLGGCATWMPAVSGKTHYDVEFSDTTAEQDTRYKMEIKAPAGTELASITGMKYDWNPDGSGSISVSQDQTTDSTAQAALIAEVNAQSMAALTKSYTKLMDVLAPFLSQYLDAQVRQGEIKAGVAHDALERLGPLQLKGEYP